MLKRLKGATLLVVTAYTAADAISDALMYYECKRLLLQRLAQHQRFTAEVGSPFTVGPWYNSSVTISPGGMLASVTIPVVGSTKGSDVTIKVARKGGFRWTLLYNLMPGAEWQPLVMNALIGGAGSLPTAMSLLELEEPSLVAGTSASHEPCFTHPPGGATSEKSKPVLYKEQHHKQT